MLSQDLNTEFLRLLPDEIRPLFEFAFDREIISLSQTVISESEFNKQLIEDISEEIKKQIERMSTSVSDDSEYKLEELSKKEIGDVKDWDSWKKNAESKIKELSKDGSKIREYISDNDFMEEGLWKRIFKLIIMLICTKSKRPQDWLKKPEYRHLLGLEYMESMPVKTESYDEAPTYEILEQYRKKEIIKSLLNTDEAKILFDELYDEDPTVSNLIDDLPFYKSLNDFCDTIGNAVSWRYLVKDSESLYKEIINAYSVLCRQIDVRNLDVKVPQIWFKLPAYALCRTLTKNYGHYDDKMHFEHLVMLRHYLNHCDYTPEKREEYLKYLIEFLKPAYEEINGYIFGNNEHGCARCFDGCKAFVVRDLFLTEGNNSRTHTGLGRSKFSKSCKGDLYLDRIQEYSYYNWSLWGIELRMIKEEFGDDELLSALLNQCKYYKEDVCILKKFQ